MPASLRKISISLLILLALAASLAPGSVWAAAALELSIDFRLDFYGDLPDRLGACAFILEREDAASPLPQGHKGNIYTFAVSPQASKNQLRIPSLTFSREGIYWYSLCQAPISGPFDYDPTIYYLQVLISRNVQSQTLQAQVFALIDKDHPAQKSDLVFRNTFPDQTVPGESPSAGVGPGQTEQSGDQAIWLPPGLYPAQTPKTEFSWPKEPVAEPWPDEIQTETGQYLPWTSLVQSKPLIKAPQSQFKLDPIYRKPDDHYPAYPYYWLSGQWVYWDPVRAKWHSLPASWVPQATEGDLIWDFNTTRWAFYPRGWLDGINWGRPVWNPAQGVWLLVPDKGRSNLTDHEYYWHAEQSLWINRLTGRPIYHQDLEPGIPYFFVPYWDLSRSSWTLYPIGREPQVKLGWLDWEQAVLRFGIWPYYWRPWPSSRMYFADLDFTHLLQETTCQDPSAVDNERKTAVPSRMYPSYTTWDSTLCGPYFLPPEHKEDQEDEGVAAYFQKHAEEVMLLCFVLLALLVLLVDMKRRG